MMRRCLLLWALAALGSTCEAFGPQASWSAAGGGKSSTSSLQMIFGGSGGGNTPKIPASTNDRDNRAIASIQRALSSPKNPTFPLVECEFPPLGALNKLGDGSSRSAQAVDAANLSFCKKLVQSISLPLIGSNVCLLTSSAASAGFAQKAKKLGANECRSLRDGTPSVASNVVCVLLAPSTRTDYQTAKTLALDGTKVVLVNGFAKDAYSVDEKATMAYFSKPLTYNSQMVGYLLREYPGPWTTIDAVSKEVLKKVDDATILVPGTNTPDLRESGRLVQKSVDTRAIQSRRSR